MKRLLLTLTLFFAPFLLLAQETEPDVSTPTGIVVILTPIVVFFAIQVAKLIKGIGSTWILGLLVPGLSFAVAWLSDLAIDDGNSWLIKFIAGLGAVFIHQIYKKLTESN